MPAPAEQTSSGLQLTRCDLSLGILPGTEGMVRLGLPGGGGGGGAWIVVNFRHSSCKFGPLVHECSGVWPDCACHAAQQRQDAAAVCQLEQFVASSCNPVGLAAPCLRQAADPDQLQLLSILARRLHVTKAVPPALPYTPIHELQCHQSPAVGTQVCCCSHP